MKADGAQFLIYNFTQLQLLLVLVFMYVCTMYVCSIRVLVLVRCVPIHSCTPGTPAERCAHACVHIHENCAD